jgi:hypothetical protein
MVSGTQPDDDSIRHGVDVSHSANLLAALRYILLIDTSSIDPENSRFRSASKDMATPKLGFELQARVFCRP